MIRKISLLSATAIVLCLAAGSVADAQQFGNTAQDVSNRLERIERDLQTLNRQVYRDAGSAQGNPQVGAATDLPQGYAREFELRLQGMEGAMRNLTGQVERLRFDLNQLAGRLDRALGDIEYRLESGDAAPASTTGQALPQQEQRIVRPNAINNVGNATAPNATVPNDVSANGVSAEAGDGSIRTLGVLAADSSVSGALPADGATGVLPGGAIAPGSNASQPLVTSDTGSGGLVASQTASATPVSVTLPDGDAQTQYDYAFGLLKRYQFDAAADALGQFLTLHPTDPLAANAQFWLGETHFVNGDYREAAVAFATGYEKFPTAEKGPENLLKLGMSLGRLGQNQEACMTLSRLGAEYPQAVSSVKQQALAERRDLDCGDS